jgi:Protein phosphatase 2C
MGVVQVIGFWSHKQGSQPHEWEDAFAYSEAAQRIAVSDGASASSQASRWARCLVEGFIDDPFDPGDETELTNWLARRVDLFEDQTPAAAVDRSWYQEAAERQPAFGTLVAMSLAEDGCYRVVGVGDSCFFHLRAGELLESLPLSDAHDFGSTPDLVSSDPEQISQVVASAFRGATTAEHGDTLLLATDALSEWALSRGTEEAEVWNLLEQIDAEGFERLSYEARQSGEMENDDLTLVRVQMR